MLGLGSSSSAPCGVKAKSPAHEGPSFSGPSAFERESPASALHPSGASGPSFCSSFYFSLSSWPLVISHSFFFPPQLDYKILQLEKLLYIQLFYMFAVERKACLHYLSLLCCWKRSLIMDIVLEHWKSNTALLSPPWNGPTSPSFLRFSKVATFRCCFSTANSH